MGIYHLTPPSWQGEGEYRLAFYEGQVYGLENTIIFLFFILIVISMIKKILFGDKMKRQISRESFNPMMQYQHILPSTIIQDSIQQNQNNSQQQQNRSDEFDHRSSDSNGNDFDGIKKSLIIKKYSFCQKIFNFFTLIFLWSLGVSISYLFSISSGFGQVELGSSIVCCLMLFIIILYFSHRLGVNNIILFILFLLAVAISVFPLVFFQDICVCSNKESGYLINELQYLSTSFTRKYSIRQACPADELCHLYVTLPQNTHDSFFLNIHTGVDVKKITVYLQDLEKIKSEQIIQSGIMNESVNLDNNGDRNTFTNIFQGLLPNRLYSIKIVNSETLVVLKSMKYKTLPSKEQIEMQQINLNIAFGGDWSMQKYGTLLNLRLVDAQPDLILIGGNVAHDNGMKNCYHQWDIFLNNFESQIFQPLDRIIPFIFSIGNRDVGMNSQKNYNITLSPEGPLIFSWFPQNIQDNNENNNNEIIPPISARPSYHYHVVGNIVIFALDSGYIMNYDGQQLDWLKENAEKYKDYYKFAIYHYPIYPACTFEKKQKWDSPQSSQLGEKYWTPIFDKYKFVAAIENHSRHFKRTYPLINKQKNNQGGTVYFGDGNWGSDVIECDKSTTNPQLFEKLVTTGALQHFWLARIASDKIIYDAYSKDPKYYLEKEYVQSLSLYKQSSNTSNP